MLGFRTNSSLWTEGIGKGLSQNRLRARFIVWCLILYLILLYHYSVVVK